MHLNKFVCLLISVLSVQTYAAPPKRLANGMLVEEKTEIVKKEAARPQTSCGYSRPIVVATTTNNRPFGWTEYIGDSAFANKMTGKGFNVEMFKEIAKRKNLRYRIVGFQSDADAIASLKSGHIDLLLGIYTPTYTTGKNTVQLYPAMFQNILAVYYPKDKPFEMNGFASLNGKKGLIRRAEGIYQLLKNDISPQMNISLETTESAFQKLVDGEADYIIGSPYSLEAELRRYKLHKDIIPAPKVLSSATMFMVSTTATDCYKLKDVLQEGLKEYTQDPQAADDLIRKVIDEWDERFEEDTALRPSWQKTKEETENETI